MVKKTIMINLLPQEERYKLRRERKIKEFLILGFVFLTLLASLALMLCGTLFSLRGKIVFEEKILERAQGKIISSQEEELKEEIALFNQAAEKVVFYESEYTSAINVLERINQAKPEKVAVYNLSYQAEESKVSLSGYSPNRNLLLELKDNLEQEFDSVSFPPSSWVKRVDIEFSVSFIVKDHE